MLDTYRSPDMGGDWPAIRNPLWDWVGRGLNEEKVDSRDG